MEKNESKEDRDKEAALYKGYSILPKILDIYLMLHCISIMPDT